MRDFMGHCVGLSQDERKALQGAKTYEAMHQVVQKSGAYFVHDGIPKRFSAGSVRIVCSWAMPCEQWIWEPGGKLYLLQGNPSVTV